jgi:hypothetical protein
LPFTGAELTLGARVLSAARKILRRPQPVEILRYRERMRNEIREKLEWPDRGVPDVLVVRLSKKDVFPSTDSLLYGLCRVSPWFKLEAKAVHDRGFEVTLKIDRVSIEKRNARTALREDDAATAPRIAGLALVLDSGCAQRPRPCTWATGGGDLSGR